MQNKYVKQTKNTLSSVLIPCKWSFIH